MSLWPISGIALSAYLYALHKRLSTPNPAARTRTAKSLSDDELSRVKVPTFEEIAQFIKADGKATGEAYIVVGGAGLVGRYIARALLTRGETLVRIVDIVPPDIKLCGDSGEIGHISHAEYVEADITNYASIKEAISKPFGDTGRTANVVIHTVAVIRSAERLAYLRQLSYRVNVEGTQNVLRASQELGSVRSFVFTSSVGLHVQRSHFLRLGLFGSRATVLLKDDMPEENLAEWNHYCATKLEADRLVRAADGVKGIRTGILRPGMGIIGPDSIFYSHYFTNPGPHPTWGGRFSSTHINPWDLARAHLQMADALLNRPNDVAGQAFVITGEPDAYTFDDVRHMFMFYSQRGLRFIKVPVLPFYLLSHIFEVYFLGRYLLLSALSKITGRPISYLPKWAVKSNMSFLQPAMWDMSLLDSIVDDSRLRKVIGYRHRWTTAQTIKWVADVLEERAFT